MKRVFKVILWIFCIIMAFPILGGVIYFLATSDIFASSNRIGALLIQGTISDSFDYMDGLKSFMEDENVKAIIVRIDSPGGGVSAAQEIYREILRAKKTKPVVASLGSIATSGGYYIACAASKIIASPGTITGSIGVIAFFPNLTELFKKVGYQTIVIKSGKFKDTGNPGRPMTPEEETLVRDSLMQVHHQFVRDIAVARSIDESKVANIADGRIIMGEAAVGLGLVDELGNFHDAVETARLLAKMKEKPELVFYEKRKRIIEMLLGEGGRMWLDRFFAREVAPIQLRYP